MYVAGNFEFKIYSKLAHCESKTILVSEIKDLAFMLRSINQRVSF